MNERFLTPEAVPAVHEVALADLFARMLELDGAVFSAKVSSGPAPTVADHLEGLVLHEVVAERVVLWRALRIWDALTSGASWPQVAAALGMDEGAARAVLAEWARGQHVLWRDRVDRGEEPWGIDAAAYAEVMALVERADAPDADVGLAAMTAAFEAVGLAATDQRVEDGVGGGGDLDFILVLDTAATRAGFGGDEVIVSFHTGQGWTYGLYTPGGHGAWCVQGMDVSGPEWDRAARWMAREIDRRRDDTPGGAS